MKKDIITTRSDKSQIFDYNNPLFYCFRDRHFITPNITTYIPEHWHEDIEYFYVLDGCIEFMVNGKQIHLDKGEGICVNSKRVHSNWSNKGSYCEFMCLVIHPSYMCASDYIEQRYVAPILSPGSNDFILLKKGNWTEKIIDELMNLFAENKDPKTLELEIIEASFKCLRLMHENIDFSMAKQAAPIHASTFKSMMSFIQDRYMDKISLEDIASSGNVGKTLCAKIFKRYVAKTPGDYLISYRITKSMDLLTSSDLSVTDIAFQTGFTSGSHYTKTFREMVGCTPTEYRNTNPGIGAYAQHYEHAV